MFAALKVFMSHLATLDTVCMNSDGRTTRFRYTSDIGTQLLQSIYQIGNGPFPHARNAVQNKVSLSHTESSRQRAHGRTSVPQKQVTDIG